MKNAWLQYKQLQNDFPVGSRVINSITFEFLGEVKGICWGFGYKESTKDYSYGWWVMTTKYACDPNLTKLEVFK